ncbi:MAG: hypothetical protein JWP01_1486 [Myxococcales bacterium]|nr:hypothetical protein [Myxococcales bacterium]
MRSIVLAAAALTGCALDAPPLQPSWQVDVMPVLAANCVRCHGYPAISFASAVRLDSYESIEVVGSKIEGAASSAVLIARLTSRKGFEPTGRYWMPPGRTLGDYEYTVLRNWAGLVDGSMKAPRGPGRPDNATPVLTIDEVARTDTTVTLAYELRDADRDLVVGTLRGPTLGPNGVVATGVVGELVSGRGTITIDLTGLPTGTYDLVGRLDDGADIDGPEGFDDFIDVGAGAVVAP